MSYINDTEYNENDIVFDERLLNIDYIPRYVYVDGFLFFNKYILLF